MIDQLYHSNIEPTRYHRQPVLMHYLFYLFYLTKFDRAPHLPTAVHFPPCDEHSCSAPANYSILPTLFRKIVIHFGGLHRLAFVQITPSLFTKSQWTAFRLYFVILPLRSSAFC